MKTKRTYYTFGELIAERAHITITSPLDAIINNFDWSLITTLADISSDETKTLLKAYIFPKYYNTYIAYTDTDEMDWNERTGEFITWLMNTKDKYETLIRTWEANKSKLMDTVKSSTLTKFNDTPQNGGDFSDDNHTSTTTRVNNEADVGTVMARIAEIDSRIKNYYAQWADEFSQFVVEY